MKMGLLWYDSDPKLPAEKKIDEAVERYRRKFGADPNTCYVNPRDVVRHPTLTIVAKPIVHANHYLVGVDEEAEREVAQEKQPLRVLGGQSSGAVPPAKRRAKSPARQIATRRARSSRAAAKAMSQH